MSRERMFGRLLVVWTVNPGTTLTADAAAGATVLNVDDVSPFNSGQSDDGPGGTLQVGGQVLGYVDIDDDASTITLANPLPAAVTLASEDYDVLVWDDLYNQVSTVQRAMVMPAGKRHQADAVEAVVADFLGDLADGDRGGPGESCELVRDGDEWELVKVKGRPAAARGVKFCDTDTFTVKVAGDQTIELSHTPIDGSLHVAWEGVHQPASEWSLSGSTLTLPDPDGFIAVDDVIDPRYAYRDGPVAVSTVAINGASSGSGSFSEALTIPATAQDGDLLIAVILVPEGESVTPNGYTLVGQTTTVTHLGNTNVAPWTYHLEVWSISKPSAASPAPSIGGNAGANPWAILSVAGASSVAGAFSTVAEAVSASTPALTGASVHVWACVAPYPYIAPSQGAIEVSMGGSDLAMVITQDATSAPVSASTDPTSAAWMLATLTAS